MIPDMDEGKYSMDAEIVLVQSDAGALAPGGWARLPTIIVAEGEKTAKRFLEFFTANIENPNTRAAYARAVGYFLDWCHQHKLTLHAIEPIHVAAYRESLNKNYETQTINIVSTWLPSGCSLTGW